MGSVYAVINLEIERLEVASPPGKRVYGNPVPRVRLNCQEQFRTSNEVRRPEGQNTGKYFVIPNDIDKGMRIPRIWRDARVVEWARLESECTVTPYRGFESLSLRQ